MAKDINKYAQNIARARYATPAIPATGVRSSRARISVPSPSATGPAAKAPAAKVPTGVEPGEPTAPEYNPIIDAETMSPPDGADRQEAIANQARMPRFAIGNPNVGNIDLSSLLSAKANPNYDPNAPVGGANVPFQETKGIGGFFRRMFGDTANEQNVAAQEQQKAEWKAEDTLAKRRAEKKADLEEEIRLREAGPTSRFEKTEARLIKSEADRVAAENKRLELEGERLGLTKQQIEEARQDRIARLQAEKEERDIRIENMRTQNAINDAEFGLRSRVANQPRFGVHTTDKGGMTIFNQTTGEPVRTYTPGGMGMIKDAKGNMVPGMTQGGWEDYVPPVTVPKDLPPSPEVDRTTGAAPGTPRKDTMGGPLPPSTADTAPAEPARFGPFLMEEFQKRAQTLAKESGSRPNATDPLMLPMYENMAKSLGVESEGIGASRQVRRPAAAIVEKDLNSYMNKFGQLPPETQNAAVIDALNKSMKQPRYRTMPNWEYNYNAQ